MEPQLAARGYGLWIYVTVCMLVVQVSSRALSILQPRHGEKRTRLAVNNTNNSDYPILVCVEEIMFDADSFALGKLTTEISVHRRWLRAATLPCLLPGRLGVAT